MGEEEEELRQVAQLKPRGAVGKQHRAGAGWAGGRGLGEGRRGGEGQAMGKMQRECWRGLPSVSPSGVGDRGAWGEPR